MEKGERYNFLVAIEKKEILKGKRHWLFKCDCGKEKKMQIANVVAGLSKSCGCWRKLATRKHGWYKTPEYNAWQRMKARCYRETEPAYKYYGERGITICDSWMNFENFIADMGKRPDGMSLDRINVDGNYEPTNCRWATKIQQMNNTRRNVYITIGENKRPLQEWCKIYNIRVGTVRQRKEIQGMNWEEALTSTKRIN